MFEQSFFRKKHPEAQDGEVFLTNVGDETSFDHFYMEHGDGFTNIGWKTKRKGSVAYNVNGKPISGMKPVFVQRDELEEGGIDPDNLWPSKVNYKVITLWVAGVIVILTIIAFAILK